MTARVFSLRLVGSLVLVASIAAVSAVATNSQESGAPENPRAIALDSMQAYLEKIGWPKDLREQKAAAFVGAVKSSVANEFGGMTVTFDGSRPGLLSTVTVVMGANGRPVAKPVVELGDIVEAQ